MVAGSSFNLLYLKEVVNPCPRKIRTSPDPINTGKDVILWSVRGLQEADRCYIV